MPEKEYIEREALVKELNKAPANFGSGDIQYGLLIAKGIAEKQPTADVAEVVRCRDCVNLRAQSDGYSYCARWDVDDYEESVVRLDDFCSYGEKKNITEDVDETEDIVPCKKCIYYHTEGCEEGFGLCEKKNFISEDNHTCEFSFGFPW